jgi:hypothetical protein
MTAGTRKQASAMIMYMHVRCTYIARSEMSTLVRCSSRKEEK